ncbi:CPBP family intramembrane glutamic endopeptidase [Lacticaseibacillus kribbianus]|uniref:CPBP family intramembrane glutamic endopeptidase n=1 Tax=Lacticaseibacillus kribbianus TaxID=2926292 RepID=UPI001CD234E9|nr:type II CAAX endopeptidase family protein [Lacticaseibacillus kribbianus]
MRRQVGLTIGRLFIVAGLFILYQLVSAFVLAPNLIRPQTVTASALWFTVLYGGLLLALWRVYQFFLRDDKPQLYGLRRFDAPVARFMALMVAALVLVQVASSLLISWQVTPEAQNQADLIEMMQQAPLPMVLITVVGAPPVEELLFRGLLMHSFPHQDRVGWRVASGVTSSVLFGLAHTGFTDPLNLVIYVAMGGVFAATYAYTRDLRYDIGLHFLNNFAALFL